MQIFFYISKMDAIFRSPSFGWNFSKRLKLCVNNHGDVSKFTSHPPLATTVDSIMFNYGIGHSIWLMFICVSLSTDQIQVSKANTIAKLVWCEPACTLLSSGTINNLTSLLNVSIHNFVNLKINTFQHRRTYGIIDELNSYEQKFTI